MNIKILNHKAVRAKLTSAFKLVFLIYLFVWLITFVTDQKVLFEPLLNIEWLLVVIIFSCYLATTVFATVQFYFILSLVNSAPTFIVQYSINNINSFLNLILPFKSGLAFRGYYLKKYYQLRWKTYFKLILVAQLLLSAVPIIYLTGYSFSTTVFFILVLAVVLIAASLSYFGAFRNQLELSRFLYAFVSSVFFHLAWFMLLYLCFYALNNQLSYSFIQIAAFSCILSFSTLVNLTPGNIGVKEGAGFLFADFVFIDSSDAVAALILERCVYTFSILVLGGVGYLHQKKTIRI